MKRSDPLFTVATGLCPGFVQTAPSWRTGTSQLLPGQVDGIPVIAKQPVDPRPFWQDRARQEIAVYQALARLGTSPVPTAQLVAADPSVPVFIATRLAGRVLHTDRYVTSKVPAADLTLLLDTLDTLHGWQPAPADALPTDTDYPAQINTFRGHVLRARDCDLLCQLHRDTATDVTIEHGDAHLGNAILTPAGLALIDLEFTAWHPPGYDLAKLWVYLGPSRSNRSLIVARVISRAGAQIGFWVSAALVIAREIRSYRRDPEQPGGINRLRRLHRDLYNVLHHLRARPEVPPEGEQP